MNRSQILENRKTWIKKLKDPNSKKATERLEDLRVEGLCCLGHGCVALGLKRELLRDNSCVVLYGEEEEDMCAPSTFVKMVGLWNCVGAAVYGDLVFRGLKFHSLADINDSTDATPQEIGRYLESVIEGGDDSPFKPLSEYPE